MDTIHKMNKKSDLGFYRIIKLFADSDMLSGIAG